MRLKWEFIVIIALLGIFVFRECSRPSKPDSQTVIRANDSIEKTNEENRTLKMSVRTLELNLQHAKNWAKIDSARFIREITVKNQQLARKRVRIDTLILENPNLASYMQTADSVFSMMHSRIDSLEAEKQFQEGLYTDLIRIKDKEIQNLTYISGQQNVIIKEQEKAMNKRKSLGQILKGIGKGLAIGGAGYVVGRVVD